MIKAFPPALGIISSSFIEQPVPPEHASLGAGVDACCMSAADMGVFLLTCCSCLLGTGT